MANAKPIVERTYLGWSDAAKVEWMMLKELEGRKNWKDRWGPGNPWWKRYNQWLESDNRRVMRKPSFRALEWLAYDQKFEPPETAYQAETRTRKKFLGPKTTKNFMKDPIDNYNCCPCPAWPKTTYGEIGWLGSQESCKLERYGNKYMQNPPLPWHMPKISSYLANSQ